MKKRVVKEKRRFPIITPIFFVLMLCLSFSFFYVLDSTTSAGFGLFEIIFSIVFAIVLTLLASWIKMMTRKNNFLGLILSLIAVGSLIYALNYKYSGPNTNMFAIAGAVIFLIYEGFYFVKYWKVK